MYRAGHGLQRTLSLPYVSTVTWLNIAIIQGNAQLRIKPLAVEKFI